MTVDIAEWCAVQGELNRHTTFITMTNCYQQTPCMLKVYE